MKVKNKEPLEELLNTKNEYWNSFAYRLHCKATEKGLFPNVVTPLELVYEGIDTLAEQAENPAKGVEQFLNEIVKAELTAPQQLFIYTWVAEYLAETEFGGKVLTQAKDLLQSHIKRLKKESEPAKPLVQNIRGQLKELVQNELKNLPDTLKDLEPEKRLSILCKLMPFVLPKVEAVHPESGEPGQWNL